MSMQKTYPATGHSFLRVSLTGMALAFLILIGWVAALAGAISYGFRVADPVCWLFIPLIAHLYTGMFIVAHDAMHGSLAPLWPRLNNAIGRLCAGLFLFNRYRTLHSNHHLHHREVATGGDPDFYEGKFWPWFIHFSLNYLSLWQVVLVGVAFNILLIWLPKPELMLYWLLPALLSMLQLFYFGTYLPHRGEHANPHHARSQRPNHVAAFLSCYFFGYHYEHHDRPWLPWWLLPVYRAERTSQP